ncbi:MAG TPA: chorismate lyase [Gammaproteobacteria bacterium]|jgi:chorismate--pyruvate lyase|nr:chorismate lyase [Gammaproteobacteria bacterium]
MTRWKPNRHYLRADIPRPLCNWLLDTASLTLRLQQLCPGEFRVRVLSQLVGQPTLSEARALGMRPGRRAIIRQVQLLCDGRPWVYARTIIPMTSLRGRLRRLAHLGTRPLGGMLFADPGMRREIVELAVIRRGQALHAAATRGLRTKPETIWGRRAVFRIARKPLLVSEVFLPAFPSASNLPPRWKSS